MARARPDALTAAVKLLAGRERTEAALRRGLTTRGYSETDVEGAVARVRELHYLDDARVAEARARQFVEEGRSRADMVRRLEGAGVAEPLIEATLDRVLSDAKHDDLAVARQLVARRRLEGVKAARFLASRGFDEDVIRAVVAATPEDD